MCNLVFQLQVYFARGQFSQGTIPLLIYIRSENKEIYPAFFPAQKYFDLAPRRLIDNITRAMFTHEVGRMLQGHHVTGHHHRHPNACHARLGNSVVTLKCSIGGHSLQGLKWLGWGLLAIVCRTAAFVTTCGLSGVLFFSIGAAIAAIVSLFTVINPMAVLIWLIVASVLLGAALTYSIVKNESNNFSEMLNKLRPKPLHGPARNAIDNQNGPSEITLTNGTVTIKPTVKERILKILINFLIVVGVGMLMFRCESQNSDDKK